MEGQSERTINPEDKIFSSELYRMFDVNSGSARRSLQHTLLGKTIEDMPLGIVKNSTQHPRKKSVSTGSSPAKMEACMFNFPLPTPRSWTIMVEPITKRAAGLPQLQHWRPVSSAVPINSNIVGHEERSENPCVDMEEAFTTATSSEDGCATSGSSIESSPQSKRKPRIYLNGTCIEGVPLAAPQRKPTRAKSISDDGKRVFTFVNDKRMSSPLLGACPNVAQALHSLADSAIFSTPGSPEPSKVPITKERRVRKVNKKPLTFHQLEFNSETLKPFDRSVFILNNSGVIGKTTMEKNETRPPSQLLVEAAEILLELQSDAEVAGAMQRSSPIESAAKLQATAVAN
jgi:hypothetical protein